MGLVHQAGDDDTAADQSDVEAGRAGRGEQVGHRRLHDRADVRGDVCGVGSVMAASVS